MNIKEIINELLLALEQEGDIDVVLEKGDCITYHSNVDQVIVEIQQRGGDSSDDKVVVIRAW